MKTVTVGADNPVTSILRSRGGGVCGEGGVCSPVSHLTPAPPRPHGYTHLSLLPTWPIGALLQEGPPIAAVSSAPEALPFS